MTEVADRHEFAFLGRVDHVSGGCRALEAVRFEVLEGYKGVDDGQELRLGYAGGTCWPGVDFDEGEEWILLTDDRMSHCNEFFRMDGLPQLHRACDDLYEQWVDEQDLLDALREAHL